MGTCDLWSGALSSSGYGIRMTGSRTDGTRRIALVHRLAYEAVHGPIPAGLQVLHNCDVHYPVGDITYRRCHNPEHLRIGTNADNVRDRTEKGRGGGHRISGEQNYHALLSDAQVTAIRAECAIARQGRQRVPRGWRTATAARFRVSPRTISSVIAWTSWRHVVALVLTALLWAPLASTASAQVVSEEEVHNFIQAYSSKYATAAYPYEALVVDAERVAACESVRFDPAVLNNVRRGRLGEIGTYQFMPGARSIFWSTPSAAAGFDYWDPEANVAGAIWLISRGYGPRHWTCW